jgi:ubiquinone/menaquinone biosynthesis C-methylase UbiE
VHYLTRIDYRECHTSDDAVAAYHDTYASGYYAAQWKLLEQPILRRLFEEQRAKGATSMLDIACGQGRITLLGAEYFPNVLGVDYSEQMLDRARKVQQESSTVSATNSLFEVGDVRTFTADEPFDVVTAFRFFLNAEDGLRTEGLRCVRRNLAPSGVFITNVHVAATSPLAWFYSASNTARRMLGKTVSPVRNSISLRRFKRMLAGEGLRVESVHRYSLLPRLGSVSDRLAESSMAKFDRVGTLIPGFSVFSQAFLVRATRI